MCFVFQSAQKIFGGEVKNHILMFLKKEGNEDTIKGFEGVAKEFKGKVRKQNPPTKWCLFISEVSSDMYRRYLRNNKKMVIDDQLLT